ncbi:ribbon-helix-helix domain-containing protein [Aromatoleum anaerobium]|uniref:XACb0070 ribbon-helix-helix domain-containing protein n=1 Tax=Aromatoleum anaerobium TaxID=182180 RepID=A0ABX1PR57_9RHOO|nr:ribbon-helix-helix domain-containing protein [Aromatoleum anaerobium]MCK0505363.1 ribbon-helix-helix domain-containing protein [Aromatoleum anaerobium]
MAEDSTTRWTVTVSRETDLALRAFLGAQGMRKGDISRFIEDAVRWRMFDQNVQAIKGRNADIPADELQAAIDEACAAVRAEMWPTTPRPV